MFGGKKESKKHVLGCHDIGILIYGSHIVNDLFECVRIFYDEIGENLAVEGYIGLFELEDERAVGKTLKLHGFGDPRDPERANITLPVFASGKCVFTGMKIGLFGDPHESAFRHPVARIGS